MRPYPIALGLKMLKNTDKSYDHIAIASELHLFWDSGTKIFDVVGGHRSCTNVRQCEFNRGYSNVNPCELLQNGSAKVGVANTGNDDMDITLTPILPP